MPPVALAAVAASCCAHDQPRSKPLVTGRLSEEEDKVKKVEKMVCNISKNVATYL
jgi:hypothetical protein